jgi:hypothetical protein
LSRRRESCEALEYTADSQDVYRAVFELSPDASLSMLKV